MERQHAAPAYRIYQGDTVLGVVWSNAAVNMDAWVRVTYDDGSSETLRMDRFVTGSARAAQLISTIQTAKYDGYVTEGLVFSDAPQRGQTYVVLYIAQGYNPGDVRMALCKGYVYASTPLAVGQQVEPGPAGGHGHLRTINIGTPGAGADFSDAAIPTGSIWRIRGFSATLTTSATAGNREVTIRIFDGTQNVGGCVATEVQTATLVEEYLGSVGNLSSGISSSLAAGAIGIGVPDLAFNTSLIRIKTNNIQAGDQWSQGFLLVEEWVMPN